MKTTFKVVTLRGSAIWPGITLENGQLRFCPREGMNRGEKRLALSAKDGNLERVNASLTDGAVVLVEAPAETEPTAELVLVQEYCRGCGGKRWPSFAVELGPEVKELSTASTSGGSGYEKWRLLTAPLGWAENIADQFVDQRDVADQTISYNPGYVKPVKEEVVCQNSRPSTPTKTEGPTLGSLGDVFSKLGL